MEHFAVPISLQEINYTENSGLRKSYGSGKWVNYIHSIYPKNDSGYLCWLSIPGLCSYLSPSFEEKWLKPAETRLEERFEHLFKAEGIKKPSAGEIKEILNNLSADDYIDIKSKLAKFQDLNEAGLPKVYSVYRDVLESATKIVKEFENPKIIKHENIEFSIKDNKTLDLPEILQSMMETNPEKLRRIAYLCVVGSPAFGGELPPVRPESYVADMSYQDLRETILEHYGRVSDMTRNRIHSEFPELPGKQPDGLSHEVVKWFSNLTLNEKCIFLGYDDRTEAWQSLVSPDTFLTDYNEAELLKELNIEFLNKDNATVLENKYREWKADGLEKHSETYALAIDVTMFMAENLNRIGIKNVVVSEEEARKILAMERGSFGVSKFMARCRTNKRSKYYYEDIDYINYQRALAQKKEREREALRERYQAELKEYMDGMNASPPMPATGNDFIMDNIWCFKQIDGTVYGYQNGDTIYLTPAGINPNTPIHEYAHLWAKVYEKLHPEEWSAMKEELKTLPLWKEIAGSESYSFIGNDENRLAGEVLSTIVGNKGEEIMLSAASKTLEKEGRSEESVAKGAEYFRQMVTDMAVKDVFDAEGMERTGDVTLKVLQDFTRGRGVKIRKEEGEKLAAMAEFERSRVRTTEYISKSNTRFNEELQKQIKGEFDLEPHTYNLGYPGPILRSTGIPNLPIQVTSTKLKEKSESEKHEYDLNEIKDLVQFMNIPIAVFSYGDGTLAQNIIVGIEHNEKHFLVGLSLNAHVKGAALRINSIRTVFPKDDFEWLTWIQEGKSRYLDKETIKALIAQQQINPADVNHLDLDFVANIVEKFENPKVDEKYFIIDNWQYYGVFLDDKSQSIINREFRDLIPSDWKKYADHITVQYNDYSQDAISKGRALSSELGHEYSAQIVAVGKTDTAIALKVEGIETANKIAHITLAVSPEGRPVDSNKITEWNPVGPIEINGALGLSYKGKKYFHVLDDNEVVDFKIGKHSLNQQETNMNNIYLSDLDRHGVEHFRFEHIMPSRVLRGAADHSVPIHASSKMCDDAGIVGNHNRMGIPVIALRGKEYISVPPGGVYLVEEGKGNYKLLSKEAFDKRFTIVEALSENGEKTLICVRAGTKLNFAQAAAESMDKHNLHSIDILSIDSKTLSKAALFVAWELREDNPYEFVVDLSRTELEDLLKNTFEKLNAEDKEIVTNILNKTPGYGEDFVEKRINGESQFNPDIETLLVDDLTVGGDVLDRSMFYIATRNMNDEQVQALRDSVKEKVMAYYAGIEMDAPNASMEKAEADTEKLLHSWFRPWTRLAGRMEYHLDKIQHNEEGPVTLQHIEAEARDAMTDERYAPYIERELKGWIRNRCADYGLDYTKLPDDLQYEGAAETYRQMFPEYVKDTKIDTLTRDAILAHIDKITALYPQYPQEPTKVSRKPDGSIVRQYGEFEYEQLKGGFERSKNLVLVEELDGETLQKKALYSMSSDSYGEHPNGPYVEFWENGNIRSYGTRTVRPGSDEEFMSDILSFTQEGEVKATVPGDYILDAHINDIIKEYKASTAKMSEELKTLAKECAARKSFLDGFDYDIGVLNTEKMNDSELYSFVSENLSVLSIEQLAEAQRILEKWRNFNDMMQKNDAIDKRFSKYFAPHCEAVLERTGLDLNELHQSLPQKEFARLMRGQEVLIDGTVNTKEGPSNGLWSFRISPAKPRPDNPGFSFYLYPVKYHDGPNGKIPEHKTLPKGEDLVIKGRHFKAGSDEVEQWRLAGRGIVLETPSGLELVTPGKYDSTVGIARSISYIEKRLTSLEHADLHLRPFKDDGSIKKEKTKGFQIGGEDIPKLARGEEVVLTTKDGVKACVRYDCGENNLIEVIPFAIAKRMELRDELKQKDKANLEKVIKEVGRPSSKELDNNIRKK